MTKAERLRDEADQQRRAERDRIGARAVTEFRQIMRDAPGTDVLAAMRRACANQIALEIEQYNN